MTASAIFVWPVGQALLTADSGCAQIYRGDLAGPAVTSEALPQVLVISRTSQFGRP